MPQVARVMVNGVERRLQLDPDRSLLVAAPRGARPDRREARLRRGRVRRLHRAGRRRAGPRLRGLPVARSRAAGDDGRGPGAATGSSIRCSRRSLELGAMQCGYCTAGMIMSAAALLATEPDPDEAQIAAALDGNLCRCCAYPRIVRAVVARRPSCAPRSRPWPRRVPPPEPAVRPAGAPVGPARRRASATGSPCSRTASSSSAAEPEPGVGLVVDERRRLAARRRRRRR